jgi:glycosyltransferase involved in cell wall biosynthesis
VRLLVFHGYLLRGTGSNIYNVNLVHALVRLGHDVHLLCQEPNPAEFGFVDSIGEWNAGQLEVRAVARPAYYGRCTVYRPDIGGLLPVYVYDRYEGFEVKTFAELSDTELDDYLRRNVAAVRDVASFAEPEAALANHLVMGPVILSRALDQVPYAVKIHGSALEYVVKPHYQRFAPYAREGLVRAQTVLVGSRHTAESLWAAMPLEDLPERTRLGPPGVDTKTFAPRPAAELPRELDGLVRWLEAADRNGFDARAAEAIDVLCDPRRERPPSGDELAVVRAGYDPSGIDVEAPRSIASLDPLREPVVFYVGKLILAKGVDLLLAAWPLVLARRPRARLVLVGYGTYREGVEILIRGLERADERLLSHVFRQGSALEGGTEGQLTYLRTFFESLNGRHERYFAAARKLRKSLVFTGRLDHGELARLLPAAEALVMPSMLPEAFGMVAAEAAACGAFPICAGHGGLAEVASLLQEGLPDQAAPLLTFERGLRVVDEIAYSLNAWFDLDDEVRAATRARLVETVRRRLSWEKVAQGVIAGALGKLDQIERVPASIPFAPSTGT